MSAPVPGGQEDLAHQLPPEQSAIAGAGTAVGAGTGAALGAAVGGIPGAAIGAALGATMGHIMASEAGGTSHVGEVKVVHDPKEAAANNVEGVHEEKGA